MSTTWRQRATHNWREYLTAHIHETNNRAHHCAITIDEYLRLRDKTGVMHVLIDSSERVGQYEVPHPLYTHPIFQTLHQATVRAGGLINDILGLRKEEIRKDPHNIVLVLQNQNGTTRQQALTDAISLVRVETDRFLTHEGRIPHICDQLGLTPTQRTPGYQLISDMRAAIRACYDWCIDSNRYSSQSIAHIGKAGIIDPIHVEARRHGPFCRSDSEQ
jgi:hypothetical protein